MSGTSSDRLDAAGMIRVSMHLACEHVTGIADNGPVTAESGSRAALTRTEPLTPESIAHAIDFALSSDTAGLPQAEGLSDTVPVLLPDGTIAHISPTTLTSDAAVAAEVTVGAEIALLLQALTHRIWQVAAIHRYRLLADQLDALAAPDQGTGV